jgi:hypothetical protein
MIAQKYKIAVITVITILSVSRVVCNCSIQSWI